MRAQPLLLQALPAARTLPQLPPLQAPCQCSRPSPYPPSSMSDSDPPWRGALVTLGWRTGHGVGVGGARGCGGNSPRPAGAQEGGVHASRVTACVRHHIKSHRLLPARSAPRRHTPHLLCTQHQQPALSSWSSGWRATGGCGGWERAQVVEVDVAAREDDPHRLHALHLPKAIRQRARLQQPPPLSVLNGLLSSRRATRVRGHTTPAQMRE